MLKGKFTEKDNLLVTALSPKRPEEWAGYVQNQQPKDSSESPK